MKTFLSQDSAQSGPTGEALYWHLLRSEWSARSIALSEIPRKPGERIKTDRRDAEKLARCHRLAAGRTPTRRMNWKDVNSGLSVIDTCERLMAMLAVVGGMRAGEILALHWRHVFADRIEIVQRI